MQRRPGGSLIDRRGARRRASMLVAGVTAIVLAVSAECSVAADQMNHSDGSLHIPIPQDDGSLTPYTFDVGYAFMTLIYDTLLWRDTGGVPQPWLASKVERTPDGLSIRATLVAGVQWQDGVALTASDVKFTFDFVRSHPHPRFTAELDDLDSVSAPDAATVIFHLRQPSPGFLDQPLADVPIIPEHLWAGLPEGLPATPPPGSAPANLVAYDQTAPPGLPVGSGPYRLVSHDASGYQFEANPFYFKGAPAVKAIEVPVIHNPETALESLETGHVDMLPMQLPADAQSRLGQPGISLIAGPSYEGTVLLLNTRQPPFNDVQVRRAVSAAIDVDKLARRISTVYAGLGFVKQSGYAAPADHGYLHPESAWAAPDTLHRPDAIAAHAGLAPLHGNPLQLLVPNNDPFMVNAGQQVAAALNQAGATVHVQQESPGAVDHAIGDDGSQPSFQLAISSSPALASYDPDVLARFFGSNPDIGQFNYTGYQSARFDALAAGEAATLDDAQRRETVTEELKLLESDAPAVPLFFAAGTFAFRSAAYARWDFVKGTGILDKLSFVQPANANAGPAPRSSGSGIVSDSADTGPPVVLIGAGALVVLAIIVLTVRELVQGRL